MYVSTTKVIRISELKRLQNTVNGGPRWVIVADDGVSYRTAQDASEILRVSWFHEHEEVELRYRSRDAVFGYRRVKTVTVEFPEYKNSRGEPLQSTYVLDHDDLVTDFNFDVVRYLQNREAIPVEFRVVG